MSKPPTLTDVKVVQDTVTALVDPTQTTAVPVVAPNSTSNSPLENVFLPSGKGDTTLTHVSLPFEKCGFREVNETLTMTYVDAEMNNATICDIIAVYLKGQKILYTEAKTYCEQRLTFLMLPTIFITVACSVLNVVIKDISYGTTIVSGLNGLVAFVLALISYLKLDARAEAHRTSAYKFDKLQSYVEFYSGKLLFVTSASKDLGKVIMETESNVREIKETNQFVLPEHIRYSYPRLCGYNVFSEVKKIQTREMRLVNELKDILNDILAVQSASQTDESAARLKELEMAQKAKTDSIIRMKNEYLSIDKDFEDEMKLYRDNSRRYWQLCSCLKV